MRNLPQTGGNWVRTGAHERDPGADPHALPNSLPHLRPSDLRARLDALDAAARDARSAADAAHESADAADAARADVLALYASLFGPPELAPGPYGPMRRNPAALAFHAARATAPAPPPDPDALLGYDGAAKRLGIAPRTLRKIVAGGALRPVRIRGRVLFAPAALDAFARASVSGVACKPAGRPGARRGASPRPVATSARTFSPAHLEARR